MIRIAICGGGNLGHTMSGKLSGKSGVEVSVLTSKPECWVKKIEVIENDGTVSFANLDYISNKAENVIPNADIIFITTPSFLISDIIREIKPFIKKETWIGSVQCSGGYFLQAQNLLPNHKNIFGLQRVPYISRIKEYGKSVYLKGYKDCLKVAFLKDNDSDILVNILYDLFEIPILKLQSYWEVTLTNSNPILHPSRLYDLFKEWKEGMFYKEEPLFYEEWTDRASCFLVKCDNELMQVVEKLGVPKIPTVLEHYGVTSEEELTQKLRSIEAFKNIHLALTEIGEDKYVPNFEHRYFVEDIPFGLSLIKKVAKELNIKTPMLDEIYNWAKTVMQKQSFDKGISQLVIKNTLNKESR